MPTCLVVAEPGTAGQFDPLSWRELRMETLEPLVNDIDLDGVEIVALRLVMAWEEQNDIRWELQNLCTNLRLESLQRCGSVQLLIHHPPPG